jgi:hypothetical protein
MEKWADYGISAVKYNNERTHIVKVKAHKDSGDTISASTEWTRSEVVSAVERGSSFVTILQARDDKWRKGQDVHIINISGVKYIRTDQNHKASDNLGELPEF